MFIKRFSWELQTPYGFELGAAYVAPDLWSQLKIIEIIEIIDKSVAFHRNRWILYGGIPF